MLLAIDIGNTNIAFGFFRGGRLVKRSCLATQVYSLKALKRCLGILKADNILVCSVVPRITRVLEKDLLKLGFKRPYIIGKQIRVPLENLYRRPAQVGQDRLVNAYAGALLYGAPLVIVDFGTAVTFDVVSKNEEYLGGMIIPGLQISLDALHQRTALLPKIKLARPVEFLGRDTKNSILSGIVYGFAALSDNLAMRLKSRIGRNARLIATGGDAGLIALYSKKLDKIDKDLTLKGIELLFRKAFMVQESILLRSTSKTLSHTTAKIA